MNKTFSTLVLGLIVSGCASTLPSTRQTQTHRDILANEQVCCSTYSDFYWSELNTNDDIKLKLNNNSPVWSFPDGKSYFGAFHFSEQSGETDVHIKSLMANGEVFAPVIVLLNAKFEPQMTYDLSHFKIRYADAFGNNRYESQLKVNAEKTPYMVIYTDVKHIGDKVVVPHPAKIRAMESGEPLPIVSDIIYKHAYEGSLEIQIMTESVRQHPMATAPAKTRQVKPVQSVRSPQSESVHYYHTAIQTAIEKGNIAKALALLEEAKSLNIPQAQRVFIQAINKKTAK